MKIDIHEKITNQIIQQMETGRMPWVKPWSSAGLDADGLPVNGKTKATYQGINILLLWGAAIEHGYAANTWLTYKQAESLGGQVRKGEKSTQIVKVGQFLPKSEQLKPVEEQRGRSFMKGYNVFNIEQIDGLPAEFHQDKREMPEREIIAEAEAVATGTGADIRIGGGDAYFSINGNYVQMPPQQAFTDQVNYYSILFHELGHWTGHKSRLDRPQVGFRKTAVYAKEELIAELCAAFTCANLGIAPTVRHADYIASWLKCLKDDKKFIFQAASAASKASKFILDTRPDNIELVDELVMIPAPMATPAAPQFQLAF